MFPWDSVYQKLLKSVRVWVILKTKQWQFFCDICIIEFKLPYTAHCDIWAIVLIRNQYYWYCLQHIINYFC